MMIRKNYLVPFNMLSDVVGIVQGLEKSSGNESINRGIEGWVVHGWVVLPSKSVTADLIAHGHGNVWVLLELVFDVSVPHLLHDIGLATWVALLAIVGEVGNELTVPVASGAVARVARLLAAAASVLAWVAASWVGRVVEHGLLVGDVPLGVVVVGVGVDRDGVVDLDSSHDHALAVAGLDVAPVGVDDVVRLVRTAVGWIIPSIVPPDVAVDVGLVVLWLSAPADSDVSVGVIVLDVLSEVVLHRSDALGQGVAKTSGVLHHGGGVGLKLF